MPPNNLLKGVRMDLSRIPNLLIGAPGAVRDIGVLFIYPPNFGDVVNEYSNGVNSPNPKPVLSPEVKIVLERFKHLVQYALSFSDLTEKIIVGVSIFNIVSYHLTGWLPGMGLTNLLGMMILGSTFLHASKIRNTLIDIEHLLIQSVGTPSEVGENSKASILQKPSIRYPLTLSHVQSLKEKVSSLQEKLFFSTWPLSFPFTWTISKLEGIEGALQRHAEQAPQIEGKLKTPEEINRGLDIINNITQQTQSTAELASRIFMYYTVMSLFCYHNTHLLSKATLNYIVSIALCSVLYFVTSKIAETYGDLQTLLNPSKEEEGDLKFYLMLDRVRTMKKKLLLLQKDLFFIGPLLNSPKFSFIVILEALERIDQELTDQLPSPPKSLKLNPDVTDNEQT